MSMALVDSSLLEAYFFFKTLTTAVFAVFDALCKSFSVLVKTFVTAAAAFFDVDAILFIVHSPFLYGKNSEQSFYCYHSFKR